MKSKHMSRWTACSFLLAAVGLLATAWIGFATSAVGRRISQASTAEVTRPSASAAVSVVSFSQNPAPSMKRGNFNIHIQARRSTIHLGGSVVIRCRVTSTGRSVAGIQVWPYVDGRQWGAPENTGVGGLVDVVIPLPYPGTARIQLTTDGPTNAIFPVGLPLTSGAPVSNTVAVNVLPVIRTPPVHPRHLVGIEYEPWFTPMMMRWQTAEAVPLIGRYNSFDPAVVRQHALWFDRMGINYILIDWTNNLWGDHHFNQINPRFKQLIASTTFLMKTYARMRQEKLAVPKITLLLGLKNGPHTTTTAINEEMQWVDDHYIRNPDYRRLWLDYHHKPLMIIFNSGGPAFLARKLSRGEPPINTRHFTIRWMSSQLQNRPQLARMKYWSWMDGTTRPVSTWDGTTCEALTITPAFFAAGGWLAPPARGRDNGFTYVREFNTALRDRPHFLNICQWNEFAGQPVGRGYGVHHNIYMDCYNVHFNNDIEPTSLTDCGCRGCGGWGFYYYNLTRAFLELYHKHDPKTTLVVFGRPGRDAVEKGSQMKVRWACAGKAPSSFTLRLDGHVIAHNLPADTRSFHLNLRGLKPGRHALTLLANGARSDFKLSYRRPAHRLQHPIPAAAHGDFLLK